MGAGAETATTGGATAPRLLLVRLHERSGLSVPGFGLLLGTLILLPGLLAVALVSLYTERAPQAVYNDLVLVFINAASVSYSLAAVLNALIHGREDLLRLQPLTGLSAAEAHAEGDRWLGPLPLPMRLLVLVAAGGTWYLMNLTDLLTAGMDRLGAPDTQWNLLWGVPLFGVFWFSLWYVICIVVRMAGGFARIGRDRVRVDLLAVERLAPFMRAGLRLTMLSVLGLTLIPLQGVLTGRFDIWTALPALCLIAPMTVYVLLRPMWGVHLAIVQAKQRELARIAEALGYNAGRELAEVTREEFARLLLYRAEIERASEWPHERSEVHRLLVYVLIPPLAWLGAALFERLVSRLI